MIESRIWNISWYEISNKHRIVATRLLKFVVVLWHSTLVLRHYNTNTATLQFSKNLLKLMNFLIFGKKMMILLIFLQLQLIGMIFFIRNLWFFFIIWPKLMIFHFLADFYNFSHFLFQIENFFKQWWIYSFLSKKLAKINDFFHFW